jgi:hypothetical protein
VELYQEYITEVENIEAEALDAVCQIEELVQNSYKLNQEDRNEVIEQFGVPVASFPWAAQIDVKFLNQIYINGINAETTLSNATQQRQLSSSRHLRLDELCRVACIPPKQFIIERRNGRWLRIDELTYEVNALLQYLLGCYFGRWDIRFATQEKDAPKLADPFAPLSACSLGQLQNSQGLPACPYDVPTEYPFHIPWDGIIVDDPTHLLDIERQTRLMIIIIWGDRAEYIEREICEILELKSLREYFTKPSGFFTDHLKRYSKSRRQAPIYWPLSTASGSYTLWIYYHRLTPDTLYKCLQQFVNPKIAEIEKELAHLQSVIAAGEGSTKERKQLDELESLRREIIELRDELEIWAPKWKPNLNDGVLITASPLWKLFRLPKWQKDLKACWQELEKGDYDWAHLALSLWPDRVREKCKRDRSIAIAHGLEELCEVKPPAPNAKKGPKKKAPPEEQIEAEL